MLKNARDAYRNGNYSVAISTYAELLKADALSVDYNFEMGLSVWQAEIKKENSLSFFEKAFALDTKKSIKEIAYYCALASHYSGNFDEAIKYYNLFRVFINPSSGDYLLKEVNQGIEMCKNAKEILKYVSDSIQINNLGTAVNTSFSEYAPVIRKDGASLLFTSRKSSTTEGMKSGDAKFYEDIYVSVRKDEEWLKAVKIDSVFNYTNQPFNSSRHNAAIAFNKDETILYLYKDADIYESRFINEKWSDPVKMSARLNTRELEPSLYISPDEKYLLLVSTRKGGLGGRDIYMLEKTEKGEWSEAQNLGKVINTGFDDDAPFISADGNTLYFSSKGHNSMGGYDVFRSVKNSDGEWAEPQNLGAPVNTTGDDIFYVEDNTGKIAYLASNRMGGAGGMDIYEVTERKLPASDSLSVASHLSNNSSGDTGMVGADNSITKDTASSGQANENSLNTNSVVTETQMGKEEINSGLTDVFFEQYFGYNQLPPDEENIAFNDFMKKVSRIFNQKQNVEIFIEASASRVPTSTYSSNSPLAEKRFLIASANIEKALNSLGIPKEKYQINRSVKVQGPAYNNDYETNQQEYGKYQYVKITIR